MIILISLVDAFINFILMESECMHNQTLIILLKGSCPAMVLSFNVSHQYSKVCGRVIGNQFGNPAAFEMAFVNNLTINKA